jgi:hypothetical protein
MEDLLRPALTKNIRLHQKKKKKKKKRLKATKGLGVWFRE